jgi:hypothetical protein
MTIKSIYGPDFVAECGPFRLYQPDVNAHPDCFIVKHSRHNTMGVRQWPLQVYNMLDGANLTKGRDDINNPLSTYSFLFKGGTVRVDTNMGVVEIQKTHPRLNEVLNDFGTLGAIGNQISLR